MTPEEKLLRAIFGEKARDVRDTSLRVPPGVTGTVVEVRVFSRRGVDKDERALAIERAEIERLAKDRDDEKAILERSFYGRLKDLLVGKTRRRSDGPKGIDGRQHKDHREAPIRLHTWPVAPDRGEERQAPGRYRGAQQAVRRVHRRADQGVFETRSTSCSAATSCRRA